MNKCVLGISSLSYPYKQNNPSPNPNLKIPNKTNPPPREDSRLPVVDVRHGPLVVDVHVQPLGPEVLGDHAAGLDDAARLGEVALAEDLGCVSTGSDIGLGVWQVYRDYFGMGDSEVEGMRSNGIMPGKDKDAPSRKKHPRQSSSRPASATTAPSGPPSWSSRPAQQEASCLARLCSRGRRAAVSVRSLI